MKTKPLFSIVAFSQQLLVTCSCALFFAVSGEARTWTSPDGGKTFEGELKSYDPESGLVSVKLANGKILKFPQDKV